MDEAKKFWVDAIGGVLIKVGPENREIITFPNALMLLRAQKPTGGSKGSTVDHIGFSVKNLRQVVDRIKAGGFRMVTSVRGAAQRQGPGRHRHRRGRAGERHRLCDGS